MSRIKVEFVCIPKLWINSIYTYSIFIYLAQKKKAAQQARILFVVCTVFGICHTLRVTLGIHEFFVLDEYLEAMSIGCPSVKFEILVLGCLSSLLLTLNSSMNFFIYTLTSKDFRRVFLQNQFCNSYISGILLNGFGMNTNTNNMVTGEDQNENFVANEMIELNNGHTTEDGSNTNQNDITASQSSP